MQNIQRRFYTGSGFSDWEIGDVTIILHDGIYHLFHLIIPNHDYIAHAVSKDCISWKRVKNALFVGDPGEWDDDMLWTMHVCKVGERFEMYYTGLQRKLRGTNSLIGLAVSYDLYSWEKKNEAIFPIESKGPFYESMEDSPRKWLSFRDPFRLDYDGEVYYLICARSAKGPISRRGCIGLLKQENDSITYLPPLHYPMVYDDLECPCAFELNGRFYSIASIREDVKVRYWFSDQFQGEYHAFHANVLLPQGNYAARVVESTNGKLLIYAFFYTSGLINSHRVFLPPKQLDTDDKGRLLLKSFDHWEDIAYDPIDQNHFKEVRRLFGNPTANLEIEDNRWVVGSKSGYEIFVFEKPADDFIWEGVLSVEGMGKLGLVTDMDEDGSGYYYSFDVVNGHVEVRAWGFNDADNRSNFKFTVLQDNIFAINKAYNYHFKLIRFGNYIELAIDGLVKLTLIDYSYSNQLIGIYSASSVVSLNNSFIKKLPPLEDEYIVEELKQ
ncbi:glycoside hydrolase family protein [Niabella ginsengisoli]|uniref:beta-fructofuranosidase n=1 Tax=Niabella ginsengisoli TaxID=522298 RepID=A0ABS9SDT5_9BACT|nr:glycosyl hydrolase family 32 [Niabella ginsengisoli]MCH5596503.1 glycosyl hydrolase family 32 [Niabella ginsengisoli]